jgi:ribonuclease P protein component
VKREFRLTQSADFIRVRRQGRSYAHPLVILVVLPNQSSRTRVGLSASKAIGGAVQRNRAKRLMRHAMASLLEYTTPGYDIILLARKPILNVKCDQARQALKDNLIKAELMQDDQSS